MPSSTANDVRATRFIFSKTCWAKIFLDKNFVEAVHFEKHKPSSAKAVTTREAAAYARQERDCSVR